MNGHDAVAGLSAAGIERREAILAEMRTALDGRRRRRIALRTAAVVAPTIALAAAGWWIAGSNRPGTSSRVAAAKGSAERPTPGTPPASTPVLAPPPTAPYAMIAEVQTTPGISEWFGSGGRSVATIEFINDDELLEELRAAGKPTGLIRTAGKVILTARVAPGQDALPM